MKHTTNYDPRTVAREIPGVFDTIFPQLTPGIVAHLNANGGRIPCRVVPRVVVDKSKIQRSMLFEICFVAGERLLAGNEINLDVCLEVAVARQRRFFDARLPKEIGPVDREIVEIVGSNMALMISTFAKERGCPATPAPHISGFQWVSSGLGDFAISDTLLEVKCSNKNFSSSDYRQIVMYWLLSFAASLERGAREWTEGILMNPRSGEFVRFDFDRLLGLISSGRSKVEILQIFASVVGTRDQG